MSVKLAYNRNEQFSNGTGVPYSGAKLFTYVGGSVNTKQTTYTESTGSTPNTNPINLDSAGQLPQPVWLTTGLTYKFVLAPSTDTDPPTSPIWTLDGITGINDSSASQSEWIAGPAPTFVSTTQFTLVGDQTTNFAKSRRLKFTVTAGTVYGTITASTFGVLTTVTVALDSGNLDSGLSAVSYGIVASANPSIDADIVYRKGTAVASAATTDIWSIAGDFVHITGNTGPITSFGTAPYAGARREVIVDSTPTITRNATTLQCPGGADIVCAAGDRFMVRADTTANMIITDFVRASGKAIVDQAAIASGRNISARTNSSTPNTKIDIAADEILLKDVNGNSFVAATVSGTIDFGTTGANGLDTSTQASGTWYYGWVIAKPDGTVALLGSTSATAPTMPTGYTFKALATAARSDGSTHFIKYRQFGNRAHYEALNSALNSSGVGTGETTVSLSSFTPPIGEETILGIYGFALASGAGAIDSSALLRYISGSTRNVGQIKTSAASQGSTWSYEATVPNVSQQVFVLFTNATNFGASQYNVDVLGFKLPLGGE